MEPSGGIGEEPHAADGECGKQDSAGWGAGGPETCGGAVAGAAEQRRRWVADFVHVSIHRNKPTYAANQSRVANFHAKGRGRKTASGHSLCALCVRNPLTISLGGRKAYQPRYDRVVTNSVFVEPSLNGQTTARAYRKGHSLVVYTLRIKAGSSCHMFVWRNSPCSSISV